ncbi:hypothetical protein DEU56DRAFT_753481 [Suillus clintonianus]|uniref:uncharacterized protein n=1 Tax=Suillus clintonianus TaxID=1904413 RepID=UPI001B86714D|nr:uncharacterized protein DEU56DRAFT_753481 [Suillus clintonianus]KAG2147655.1 hypothetical protein DEU56DRAFT_753481 [Suillus clintonianus]
MSPPTKTTLAQLLGNLAVAREEPNVQYCQKIHSTSRSHKVTRAIGSGGKWEKPGAQRPYTALSPIGTVLAIPYPLPHNCIAPKAMVGNAERYHTVRSYQGDATVATLTCGYRAERNSLPSQRQKAFSLLKAPSQCTCSGRRKDENSLSLMECVLGIAYEVGSVKIEKHHGDTANVDHCKKAQTSGYPIAIIAGVKEIAQF